MKECFLQKFVVTLQEKADAATVPIIKPGRAATNEENYLSSSGICFLQS